MQDRPRTLERAYELARSGECKGVGEIRQRLKTEGYDNIAGQLYGSTVTRALNGLCAAARASAETAPEEQTKEADHG
jgi:hypothetical protein